MAGDLFMPDGIYSFWSHDSGTQVQDGNLPAKNMYGTHPFYMAKAEDGSWFGVFVNLAAA